MLGSNICLLEEHAKHGLLVVASVTACVCAHSRSSRERDQVESLCFLT